MLVTLLAFTLRTLLGEHNRAWLLPQRAPTWDAGGFVQSWLDRRAELVTDQGGGGHHLLIYRATPAGEYLLIADLYRLETEEFQC